MKELSIEEKAKAYDRALEIAKAWCKLDNNDLSNDDLETLFPELKESEGEKTRKRIIALVNAHGQGMYKDDMLAWLENIPYTIDHEKREGFHLGYKAALEKQGTSYTKSDVDDAYLKGISDAKHELEKQGGEKPADKAEPKFKVGDWITNGDCTWKIVEVKPLDYILRTPYGNIVDDTISFVDEQFHSLTIEDAKDDDKIKPKFIKNFKNYIKEE